MAERGTTGTIKCPGCGEQHLPAWRLEGLPVLRCPAVTSMEMLDVPRSVHSSSFVFLIPTPRSPLAAELAAALDADPDATKPGPAVTAGAATNLAEEDTTTRRRRTA